MAAAKPFKVDGAGGAGIVRGPDGRFYREDAEKAAPQNPLDTEDDGRQPQQWAPGIGQQSAKLTGQEKPWPETGQQEATPGGKPFRVG